MRIESRMLIGVDLSQVAWIVGVGAGPPLWIVMMQFLFQPFMCIILKTRCCTNPFCLPHCRSAIWFHPGSIIFEFMGPHQHVPGWWTV